MKKTIVVLMTLCLVLVFADVPIYGYFWARYTYQNPTTPEVDDHDNYFSIERGYIRWQTKTKPVSFKGTVDISQKNGATNKSDWNIRLKYAEADWTLPHIGEYLPDAKLMIGLQKVYFGIVDLWEYPLIEKNLEENEGKMNSADLGIGFHSLIPGGYGEFSAQVFNGNGYTHVVEDNLNKAMVGNLSLLPLPGIMVKGSYWYAEKPYQEDSITVIQVEQTRYAGLVQLCYGPVKVTGEYLGTKDHETSGMGYCGILDFALNKTISILGRYDFFDPNTDNDNDGHNLMIGGVNVRICSTLLTQLNYQIKSYEDDALDASDVIVLQWKYSY
jgi:hypothetical protein